MDDLKTQKKARFKKGSKEARKFMADLISKRCKCQTPAQPEIITVQQQKEFVERI